jgi:membrane protein YqaA with SNARE-associated domain
MSSRAWGERLDRAVRRTEHADWLLMGASFAETIIVPIPMELVLVPHMIRWPGRKWWTATVVLMGCLAATLLGYAIGAIFMDSIGQWAIERFGWAQDFDEFRQWFQTYGFVAIVMVGVVPIPFQVAMLTAGSTGYPFLLFVLAALVARGVRYYGLAALVHAFGERATALWRSYAGPVGYATLALVLGLIVTLWLVI